MADCLVTTLKEAVTDENLLKLGELAIQIDGNAVSSFASNFDLKILGDGYFTNSNGTANYGKTHDVSSGDTVYMSPGKYKLILSNKYKPSWVRFNGQNPVKVNFDDMDYMEITSIECTNAGHYGNVDHICGKLSYVGIGRWWESMYNNPVTGHLSSLVANPTGIGNLSLHHTLIEGNLSDLAALRKGTVVDISACPNIHGNLSAIAGRTDMTRFAAYQTDITGNLSSISGLTALTYLNVSGTAVTGNLSAVAPLNSLTDLHVDSTSIAGDTSSLAGLTNLTSFTYTNCPNITGAWPLT